MPDDIITPTPESVTTTSTQSVTTLPITSADSSVFGVSVRAWIATTLVMTICATQLAAVIAVLYDAVTTKDFSKVGTFLNVGEPLYSMSVAALAFYFGQKSATSKG